MTRSSQLDASVRAWEVARRVIPGGVSRDQLYQDPPLFASRGEGPYLFDPSGVRFVDFVNNYTSLIHGHAHPDTTVAIRDQALSGSAFGAPTALEAELALELVSRLDSVEMVRFTNSGTEAIMIALQLARFATGRLRIAKFEGGYHGSHDLVKVSVKPEDGGRREAPDPVAEPGSEGFNLTDVLPYDDVSALERIAAVEGDHWAALIVEPMQGSAGMLLPAPDLLKRCRELAKHHGFLLIFDEVMTFRHGAHGLQSEWGLTPDLTTLGKIIGGGLPVGAVVGPERIMSGLAPPSPNRVHHAGTFNGNPMTMAAGLATLHHYDEKVGAALDERGDSLRSRLQRVVSPFGLSVTGYGSMMNIHGTSTAPKCWRDVRSSDRGRVAAIQRRLLKQGIFIAPFAA